MVINIGIVEDKESELENIKRTFYSFYKENCDFQDYIIDEYGEKKYFSYKPYLDL